MEITAKYVLSFDIGNGEREFLSTVHMFLFGGFDGVYANFINGKRSVILTLGDLVCFSG